MLEAVATCTTLRCCILERVQQVLPQVQCGSWQREHVEVSNTRTCLRKSKVCRFHAVISVLTAFIFWSLHNPALGEATAPLYCAILFNAMNILLNYLFVSKWRLLGIVQGVPILTTVAQTLSLIPLLLVLRKRLGTFVSVTDSPRNKIATISETLMAILASLRQYFQAGVYLMARSLVRVVTTSYCTRYAVRRKYRILMFDYLCCHIWLLLLRAINRHCWDRSRQARIQSYLKSDYGSQWCASRSQLLSSLFWLDNNHGFIPLCQRTVTWTVRFNLESLCLAHAQLSWQSGVFQLWPYLLAISRSNNLQSTFFHGSVSRNVSREGILSDLRRETANSPDFHLAFLTSNCCVPVKWSRGYVSLWMACWWVEWTGVPHSLACALPILHVSLRCTIRVIWMSHRQLDGCGLRGHLTTLHKL